jgi:hypothetical protein
MLSVDQCIPFRSFETCKKMTRRAFGELVKHGFRVRR